VTAPARATENTDPKSTTLPGRPIAEERTHNDARQNGGENLACDVARAEAHTHSAASARSSSCVVVVPATDCSEHDEHDGWWDRDERRGGSPLCGLGGCACVRRSDRRLEMSPATGHDGAHELQALVSSQIDSAAAEGR
jgi:hypothetical protein